jgi:hypothetical protein
MKNKNYLPDDAETLTYTDWAPRHFSAACSSKLEALKKQLVRQFTAEYSDVQEHLVRQAVNEAQALATLTTFPHLLLPALAEEKVQGVRDWTQHQQALSPRRALARAA